MKTPPLRIIPLGGLGEIGLNLMVMECGNDLILIDCGVLFPDLSWLGLDLVLPDFDYIIKNKEKIRGLVVTHGHEDHIGAIPFLLREVEVPIVYASPFASRLLQEKCKEYGVGDKLLTHSVHPGDTVHMGGFSVEFIHVTHSTLESFALAIQTPHGLVIHSGDFKFDETPYSGPASDKERLKQLGQGERPLLLLSDSTNSERCGHSKSERSITEELDKLVGETKGAVVVALFASNIHRVHQLMDIAEKYGRHVFLSGRSMQRYVHIALEQNHLTYKGNLLQPIEDVERFPRKKILVLSTGSQGEARSSLFRLAKNENRFIKLRKDDAVILSSRNIPGNERAINHVINMICKLGADIHYEDMKSVHASGHAYYEEQMELIEMLRPRFFIPIHGEYRQLALHAKNAMQSGFLGDQSHILENGTIWSFDGHDVSIEENAVVHGRKWYFHHNTGYFEEDRIKDRRRAARAGIISVVCHVQRGGSDLLREPEIKLSGFLGTEKLEEGLIQEMKTLCTAAFEEWTPHNTLANTREQAVAHAVKKLFKKHFDLKPLVIVHFLK
jgi:ribonuclease J